jgi:hypothetical protein
MEALEELFEETRSGFEDWTENTRVLCRACSEGRPHEQHDHELKEERSPERRLGIAAYPGDNIEGLFAQWEINTGGKLQEISPEIPRKQNAFHSGEN